MYYTLNIRSCNFLEVFHKWKGFFRKGSFYEKCTLNLVSKNSKTGSTLHFIHFVLMDIRTLGIFWHTTTRQDWSYKVHAKHAGPSTVKCFFIAISLFTRFPWFTRLIAPNNQSQALYSHYLVSTRQFGLGFLGWKLTWKCFLYAHLLTCHEWVWRYRTL